MTSREGVERFGWVVVESVLSRRQAAILRRLGGTPYAALSALLAFVELGIDSPESDPLRKWVELVFGADRVSAASKEGQ